MDNLILKKTKKWGPAYKVIRVPDEVEKVVIDTAEATNMSYSQVASELIMYAIKNVKIVD